MRTTKPPQGPRMTLPELLQLRDEKLNVHPLIKDQVIAPTPAIKEAFDIVEDALIHYESGYASLPNHGLAKRSPST